MNWLGVFVEVGMAEGVCANVGRSGLSETARAAAAPKKLRRLDLINGGYPVCCMVSTPAVFRLR